MRVEVLNANLVVARQSEKLRGSAVEVHDNPGSDLIRRRSGEGAQQAGDTSHGGLGRPGSRWRHGDEGGLCGRRGRFQSCVEPNEKEDTDKNRWMLKLSSSEERCVKKSPRKEWWVGGGAADEEKMEKKMER